MVFTHSVLFVDDRLAMEFDSCPTIAPFLGYMGVTASIIMASEYSMVFFEMIIAHSIKTDLFSY